MYRVQSAKSLFSLSRVTDLHRSLFRNRGAIAASLVLCAAAAANAGVAPPSYTLTDLGTLPGESSSFALGLNDQGQVIGTSAVSTPGDGFLYTGGSLQEIGSSLGNFTPTGINNAGQIVGYTQGTAGQQAFISTAGNLQDVGSLGTGRTGRINAGGEFVAWRTTGIPADGVQGVVYSGGTFQRLNTPPSLSSGTPAVAINDSGDIVGSYSIGLVASAFRYRDGSLQDIPISVPASQVASSGASAINNLGQVVGNVGFRTGQTGFAFLYADGIVQNLGPFSAEGINDSGEIVGSTLVYPYGVLSLEGTTYNLNDLLSGASGYVVTDAVAINSGGQIAADAFTPAGQQHAILLTPTAIPLPPAAWLGLGMMGLLTGSVAYRKYATHR